MAPKLKRTLYIGLGGTGFKTLLHTKRAFIETYGEVPPMIKFLAFDSDQNQYKNYTLPSIYGDVKFDPAESSDIMVSWASDKVNRNRDELTWLPDRNIFGVEDLVNGCGMIRTNGRLAFAFNYEKTRQSIKNALNQIRQLDFAHNNKYELTAQHVEANIVFSIAGGTGSGNFIDMAYLVKDIFKEQAFPETSKIVGYMVLPDVYDAQLSSDKERLFPIAYGSLMDLDYLMHSDANKEIYVNYLTEHRVLKGAPYNAIFAISNSNTKGDVVKNSDDISGLISMAMVISAGELSNKMSSIANNFEKNIKNGDYNVDKKRAIMGTLGMSKITFRASELSKLYSEKAARETAAKLIDHGSNVDTDANTWIDTEQIRENNGQDQVIDFLLPKNPQSHLQGIDDKANPKADINKYRSQRNVAVSTEELTGKINTLKERVEKSFHAKIRNIVNANGPVYAKEFIDQVRGQIDICLEEMREELKGFQDTASAKESAIDVAIEEYKSANGKFFGKQKAVQEAEEILCTNVSKAAINDREINRRQGAITFYTWLLQEMSEMQQKLNDIEAVIRSACQILRNNIVKTNNDLSAPRGLFEIDLTQPYVNKVDVQASDININQFVQTLPTDTEIFSFDKLDAETVAGYMYRYASTINSGALWESMSVEDALAKLPKDEVEKIIRCAIDLSSPMCPLNYGGYINKAPHDYYFIGVQEQSSTKLDGDIISFKEYVSTGDIVFSSIGSRDHIVIYHQYGVFPTFAIAGTNTYRMAHDKYMTRPTAFSCFIDEDLRVTMAREGFSLLPPERSDDSLELWVKGLIFGLITRDENGTFQYKDEDNTDMALFGYITSLGTGYRDEAFKNFKRECNRLQPQYDEYMRNLSRTKGQDAIDAQLADARLNYLGKYALNDLSASELKNPLYKGIAKQLTDELNYVKTEL